MFRKFPVQVALAALVVYGLTFSHGVTANSLALTAKVAGWDRVPMVGQPVFWLLTLPLRLLPAGWVPLALNVFSAVCAALVLGILARSLELLPWPRPLASVGAWGRLPVLFGVIVCGLEFHFWQEAAAATGEIFDVLVLAGAVWCALEYRVGKKWRWLRASVVLWGLGMAQNWMMLLTLPLFVVGLVWLRPLSFLQWRFILRLAGWGLAGFSIYALLPLANGWLPESPWSFSEAWLISLSQTKQMVAGTFFTFWRAHRLILLALVLYYLLPIVACLVRFGGDPLTHKSAVDQFQIWLFRGLRTVLLLVCVWLAFDPISGPHGILLGKLSLAQPLLSFDFLNGLGAGFLAGNLLLMWQPKTGTMPHYQPGMALLAGLERLARPAVLVLALLVAGGLMARNLGAVTFVNRHPLSEFGEVVLRNLPEGGGVVLSDSPERLKVFQAAQAESNRKTAWLAVDTGSLPSPKYRERLDHIRPGLWLLDTNRSTLAPKEMVRLLHSLTHNNRVFYLHPSFGYYFESFYLAPSGPVGELKLYSTNSITPPPLTPDTIAMNERFWDDFTPRLEALQQFGEMTKNRTLQKIEKKLHLETVVPAQAPMLKEWYAVALDNWAVELQRAGRLPEAEKRFSQALGLDPENPTARANLFCNTNLQAGKLLGLADVGALAGEFRSIQSVGQFLARFGPVDEPAFCFLLGNITMQAKLPRQAIINLERSAALAPSVPGPQLVLANLYGRFGRGDQSLQAANRVRELMKKSPDYPRIDTDLTLLEAGVDASQTNTQHIIKILQSLLDRYPGDTEVEVRVFRAYASFGILTNAEALATSLLSQKPEDIGLQMAKAIILLRAGRPAEAIPILDGILSVTNSMVAKFQRAFANLQITNVAAAKADYLELQEAGASPFFVNHGLAEVALRESNTNLAIGYLNVCLTNVPPGSMPWQAIRKQLDAFSH